MNYDIEQINQCIKLFSESQKAFMRSERRVLLRSTLFDVPRRSSLGWECVYQTAYPLLKELIQRISPEEIGWRMKRLCSRPNYLTLSILMCSYLGARQQRRLDPGWMLETSTSEEEDEQICFVVDFWRRVARSYRNDGYLMPIENAHRQPILPESIVKIVRDSLTPSSPERYALVRRMMATLEIYAFILHGEQRDGLFAHGPYETEDDGVIVIREFTDLQNDYLPWAMTETWNLYPHLAVALRLRDVNVQFDLFGGVLIDPPDYASRVVACALLRCREDGSIVLIPDDEIPEITRRAAEAENELYLKAARWTQRYKIEYGIDLFANHMKSFFDVAGVDAGERIRATFRAVGRPVVQHMLKRGALPSIWQFMATTEGDFFSPVSRAP